MQLGDFLGEYHPHNAETPARLARVSIFFYSKLLIQQLLRIQTLSIHPYAV